MEHFVMSDDDFEHINIMILSTIKKAFNKGTYFCTAIHGFEDCKQELWLAALETIEKYGEINFSIISRAIRNRFVDLIRNSVKEIDHNNYAVDDIDTTFSDSSCYSCKNFTDEFNTIISRVDMSNALKTTTPDVYKYVKLLMKMSGIIDNDTIGLLKDKDIAILLGYSSSSSRSYRRLKERAYYFFIKNGIIDKLPATKDKEFIKTRTMYMSALKDV